MAKQTLRSPVTRFAIATTLALTSVSAWAGPAGSIDTTFVAMGPGGSALARAITHGSACPQIMIDGREIAMQVRAPPATEALRPTASTPNNSKPSAFPVLTCDAPLPRSAKSASIAGHALPIPRREIRRIVVIGDTGCRLKAADDAWQACNDPAAYPFAHIAAKAADWKPDLVVHVGDYLYRENPCPEGREGCAGSPWGYGWDAWRADFFAPGARLLGAAPWAFVRGNHESCARAGQGWWRFLDPRPLEPRRDCNDPANDTIGDYSPAYPVSLGKSAQVVVMDLSAAGTAPLPLGDPRIGEFQETWRELDRLSKSAGFTFAADHYPVFGVAAPGDGSGLAAGNDALQGAFSALDAKIMPSGVDALLAGHIHLWQQVDFGGRQPSQFVAGFSGTQEDIVPLPDVLPEHFSPAPDVPVRQFSAIVDKFGFMTLERTGTRGWAATVYSAEGAILQRCRIKGRSSRCDADRTGLSAE